MFGLIKKTKAANILVKALQQQATLGSFSQINGLINYGFNDSEQQLNAYATVDDLYSIVRKIAKTCKRVPLYVYEVKNQKEFGTYKQMRIKAVQGGYSNKRIWDLKDLQTKSLEIIGEQDPLQKLLDTPNDFQSRDEFYEGAYSFPLLCGNEYIYLNLLEGGRNTGVPFSMYHLPPNFTYPIVSQTFPRKIEGFSWMMGGITILQTSDVIHRKYFNPIYTFNGSELIGLSPLHAAQRTLTQIGNERDYANRSLINAGAEGFISSEDAATMTPGALGQLKDDVLRELGSGWTGSTNVGGDPLRNTDFTSSQFSRSNLNAKKLGFLAGKWDYHAMAISPADMQLIQQSAVTFKKLCNVFGISDILFNNDSAATESNVNNMIRQMYTNVVLPEVSSLRDSLQQGLAMKFTDKKRIIDFDASDINELQEDTANIVQRFVAAPAFRVNDMFEALGFGKIDDPNADIILVKTGYVPLEDITTPLNIVDPGGLGNAGATGFNTPNG